MKRNKLIVGIGLLLIGVFALYGFATAQEYVRMGVINLGFSPEKVAVATDGTIYVTAGTDEIYRYDGDGNSISPVLSSPYSGSMFYGITVDSDDNVYVADKGMNDVLKYTSTGSYDSDMPGCAWTPYAIAYAYGSGNLWVADRSHHKIYESLSWGNCAAVWHRFGQYGTGDGYFISPSGIAVADGNVYVADRDNHRVQRCYDAGTTWICTTCVGDGSPGSGNNQFAYPTGITFDSAGNMFVTDTGKYDTDNHCVKKFMFDTSGNAQFDTKWGSFGDADGDFKYPSGIAVGPDDKVYVADRDNLRIQIFALAIEANIDIHPDTINLKSNGNWITCYIELPDGYDVSNIDVSKIILTIGSADDIPAEPSPTEIGDYDNDNISDLMVKFDRGAVHTAVEEGTTVYPASVDMTVRGSLTDETQFEGSDTVLVVDKGQVHVNETDHSSVEY